MENVKHVVINGRTYDVPETVTSITDIREAAIQMDPGLSNADAIVEEDTVVFRYRAGTKGALEAKQVVINNRAYNIPEGITSLEDIRAAAIQMEPGLSNADAVIEDDQVVFRYRAGTKG